MGVVETRNQTVIWYQGAYKQGIWLTREIRLVPPIRIMCIVIWDIGWRLALTNKIGLIREHLSYCWNGRTLLTHMLS